VLTIFFAKTSLIYNHCVTPGKTPTLFNIIPLYLPIHIFFIISRILSMPAFNTWLDVRFHLMKPFK
jgi:hypothetical protein